MHRPPDTRQRRKYIGTASMDAHCCSLDEGETMWKVYLNDGPTMRLFMRKGVNVVVMRLHRAGSVARGQMHCPKCDWPGVYIRTRYFETMTADVWMCDNSKCEAYRLYWHDDKPLNDPAETRRP